MVSWPHGHSCPMLRSPYPASLSCTDTYAKPAPHSDWMDFPLPPASAQPSSRCKCSLPFLRAEFSAGEGSAPEDTKQCLGPFHVGLTGVAEPGSASWGARQLPPQTVTQPTTLRRRSTAVEPLATLALYLGGWITAGGGGAGGFSRAALREQRVLHWGRPRAHTRNRRATCTAWENPGGHASHGPQQGPSGLQLALAQQRVPQRHPWGTDSPGGEPPCGLSSPPSLCSPAAHVSLRLASALPSRPPPVSGIPCAPWEPSADRFSPSLSLSGCAAFVIKYCYIYLRIG